MKYIQLVTLLICFSSCNKKLDKTDIDSVLKYGEQHILNRNFDSLLTLTEDYRILNSIDIEDKISILVEKSRIETKFERLELLLNNANESKFLKSQIKEDVKYFSTGTLRLQNAEYFFQIDKEYYKFTFNLDKSDGQYYLGSFRINNLSKECKQHTFVPSTNISIQHEGSYWSRSSRNTFKDYSLRLKNISDLDYSKFEYRLIIKDNKGKQFFNRVFDYKGDIGVDEIIDIRVSSLENYKTNFFIDNKNFFSEFQIISVTTKSNPKSCLAIKSLQ
ncbi:hypothetical protein [Costertonia aggregata]|uniref:Uncharacterized protein n=1 Tax=Costertonia aggregata TaxID=343403 RepID=A0A7H9AQ76_9FLAO|nr:hypothetical protein [Costertonia aggregata]QLG45405.1 hypothetical protein HYG79_08610 [Costertonia aggregata]